MTAKEIDNMSIEEIEQSAEMLTEDEKNQWAGYGYSGAGYIKIIKNRS